MLASTGAGAASRLCCSYLRMRFRPAHINGFSQAVQAQQGSPPAKPTEPGPEDCCQNSCVECVWNVYWRELHEYECALAAWEGRAPPQAAADPFEEMERRLEQEEEQRKARAAAQPRPPKPDRPKVSHTGESYLVR